MMKKITPLFITCILFMTTGVFGQSDDTVVSPTGQGKILVGGSSAFNFASTKATIKSDDSDDFDLNKTTSFSISPAAGYFVIDNLALGLSLDYNSIKIDSENEGTDNKTNSFVVAPFARYYFAKGSIRPFLQASAGLGSSATDVTFFDVSDFDPIFQTREFKSSIFAYSIDGGVAFFLNDIVSIDLGVGYASASSKPKDDNEDNRRTVNSGLGFTAGFNIFL